MIVATKTEGRGRTSDNGLRTTDYGPLMVREFLFRSESVAHLEMSSPDRLVRRQSF